MVFGLAKIALNNYFTFVKFPHKQSFLLLTSIQRPARLSSHIFRKSFMIIWCSRSYHHQIINRVIISQLLTAKFAHQFAL